MRVDKLTLERIFERTERLEAPLFQRPYVWKQVRNWVPLWEAIKQVAEARLAGMTPRPCFLGAIVLDQLKTSTGTATIRRASDQVYGLFLRNLNIFPPNGLEIGDNFFSLQRKSTELTPGRKYIGICAPGRRLNG